jgi:hypothetical protein
MTNAAYLRLLSSLACAPLAGCLEIDFAPREIIEETRVIGAVVDPPLFRAGDRLTVRALVVNELGENVVPDGEVVMNGDGDRSCTGSVCFDWTFCVRPERTPGLSSLQYDPEVPSQGCENASISMMMGESPFLTVNPDGTLEIDTTPLSGMIDVSMLETLAAAIGLPPEIVERVLSTTGIPVTVELRLFLPDETKLAYKNALFLADACTSDCPGRNPPAPELAIWRRRTGDRDPTFITGRGIEEPFTCARCDPSEEGCLPNRKPLDLLPNERYVLAPVEDGEAWLERYTVLDLTGSFVELDERGYFSWFSNAGAFGQGQTYFPVAEEILLTPGEPGTYALWVVSRDGHFGANACRIEYTVRN